MTQTLDVHARISELDRSAPVSAAAARTGASTDRFATFAITFGIAFAILYTVFERLNWPLFTYHPAVGKVDFWMHAARSGEGPPMYWYGWVFLAGPAALVVASAATLMPRRLLQEATFFCCTLAILWPIVFCSPMGQRSTSNGLLGPCGPGSRHLWGRQLSPILPGRHGQSGCGPTGWWSCRLADSSSSATPSRPFFYGRKSATVGV